MAIKGSYKVPKGVCAPNMSSDEIITSGSV